MHNNKAAGKSAHLTSLSLNDKVLSGLTLLGQAFMYAQDVKADVWDFALKIDKLYESGLSISDIRWLVAKGFAAHGQETTVYGDVHRSFRHNVGFNFGDSSCLVFTARGALLAEQIFKETGVPQPSILNLDPAPIGEGVNGILKRDNQPAVEINGSKSVQIPNWDPTRRELSLADAIVKRFRVPARNQETILCVFEEEGWPQHIDDPLPVISDIDPHTRLHDAINRLNRHQTNRLLRFHGNGHGTGILWERLDRDLSSQIDVPQ